MPWWGLLLPGLGVQFRPPLVCSFVSNVHKRPPAGGSKMDPLFGMTEALCYLPEYMKKGPKYRVRISPEGFPSRGHVQHTMLYRMGA